jgi:uncharacterized membrane protein HdeD (DUF308 family)
MFVVPGSAPGAERRLTREIAERIARYWWVVLLDGAILVVAGVLIFSIDWTVRSLATFLGALFIFQGLSVALTPGFGRGVRGANALVGLLSIAAGVAIIVWPGPGLLAVAIFLGSWLIVVGTVTIVGAFAARRILPTWWLVLILGLLEVPLGVLALADPGATLAALVTVGGIWAVAIGIMRIVLAFELKRLPDEIDEWWARAAGERAPRPAVADQGRFTRTPS